MVVTPHVRETAVHNTPDGRSLHIAMEIPADLAYFEGHFAACPLLPGVVQLNWAVEFGRRHLAIAGEFAGIAALKFRRVIQPGDLVELSLNFDAIAGRLRFEYCTADGVCSSGLISFAR